MIEKEGKVKVAEKIYIYGFGNPGRQDDGLGNAMVEKLHAWVQSENMQGFEFDSNYQLNIEDAHAIHDKDLVIFIDASTEDISNFKFSSVDGTTQVAFTTHTASPGFIISLCREIFKKIPPTYLLHIKGNSWEFKEGLSGIAIENLELAFEDLKNKLKSPGHLISNFKYFNLS